MKKSILFCLLSLSLNAQDFEIFAHRGFRGLFPENTLTAFTSALHYTPILEMDIMLSKDLEVVVTHDPKIHSQLYLLEDENEITKADEKIIYELNYAQISSYILGLRIC